MSGFRRPLPYALIAIAMAGGFHVEPRSSHVIEPARAYAADARPLPFFYDLYTFRGTAGKTTVVTAYAVEAGELEREYVDDRVQYRFSVTLVLTDTELRTVHTTHDTVFVDVARALRPEHLLFTHVEVLAPPSTAMQQQFTMIDATTPGIGQLYNDALPIPDYSGDHLMISDIAFGHADADSGWRRRNATLALLPTRQFPTSEFNVYYEIYNLPVGRTYTTEIAFEPLREEGGDRDDRRPVRLQFTGESAAGRDGVLAELRRVESSLERGSYRITVTITDGTTGEKASRSRNFEVRGWERGATMVAARPSGHDSHQR